MVNFIGGIIGLTIGVIIMVNVYLSTVHAVNTTAPGWTTSEASIFGVLGLAGIVGLLYGVLNVFGIM